MKSKYPSPPSMEGELLYELSVYVLKILTDSTLLPEKPKIDPDIVEVLEYNYFENGFKLAKELERCGYEVEMDMVNALDEVANEAVRIITRERKKWVDANSVVLEHKIGDKVWHDHPVRPSVVTHLFPEIAQYGIWNNTCGSEKGKAYIRVNAEAVHSMETTWEEAHADLFKEENND